MIDHVNGGGCKERKKRFHNTQGFYNYLDKHRRLAKYQLLCNNCNAAKAFYGGCPHASPQGPIPLVVINGKLYLAKIYESLPQPFMIPISYA